MVCLDSSFLVDFFRNSTNEVERYKKFVSSGERIFLPSVVVMELFLGVKKRGNLAVEKKINYFFEHIDVLDFNKRSALLSGEILATLEKKGEVVDFRDVMIASVCIANDIELLTNNIKHFERLKKFGLKLVK